MLVFPYVLKSGGFRAIDAGMIAVKEIEVLPSRDFMNRTIHYAPGTGLVYLANAKVACSSMKKSIWMRVSPETYEGNPHHRALSPFCNNLRDITHHIDDFRGATFFTVARNPFSRLVSAYLDKVARKERDRAAWANISTVLGYDIHHVPTFDDLLSRIVDADPFTMDRHFALQTRNVILNTVTPDFVGHLEHPEVISEFLIKYRMSFENHSPHKTEAKDPSAFFTDRLIEKVTAYYRDDFVAFGYSEDPKTKTPVMPLQIPKIDRAFICRLL